MSQKAQVKFDWIVQTKTGDKTWKKGSGYDKCPKKDVLGKVKGWDGEGVMPAKVEKEIQIMASL